MESFLSKQSAFLLFFIKLLVFVQLPVPLCAYDLYTSCSNRFNCGKITNVGYPFWGDGRPDACGVPDLKLNCAKGITTIEIKNVTYRVLAVNESTKIINIVREDYWGGICTTRLANTTLDLNLFDYGPGYGYITLGYGCLLPGLSTCAISGFKNTNVIVLVRDQSLGLCNASVVFPVDILTYTNYSVLWPLALIEAAIKGGFNVKWKEDTAACSACIESKGVCGYDVISKNGTCYCPNQSSGLTTCPSSPTARSPQVPSIETDANDDEQFLNCSKPIDCASAKNLSYPFWGSNRPDYCGHPGFELDCSGDAPKITITFIKYRVLEIDYGLRTLHVARADYWNTICPPTIVNTTINFSIFSYPSNGLVNLTLYYECSSSSSIFNFSTPAQLNQVAVFNCSINGSTGATSYYSNSIVDSVGACKYNVKVPVVTPAAPISLTEGALIDAIDGGFVLEWNVSNSICDGCQSSGGLCGFNTSTNAFACHCANGNFPYTCGSKATAPAPDNNSNNNNKSSNGSLVVGLGIGGAGIVAILLGFWIFSIMQRRKRLANESKSKDLSTPPSTKDVPAASIKFSQSTPSYPFLKSDLEKGSTYFGAHIFSYEELEEATDNFDSSRELGDGGFGKVYYGKLHDGRVVAVKRLYENNFKRVEQFMTEIAILTRLRHQNLVTLYGCTSKRSQELLLVYEYIPNGTVADHLHGNRSNSSLLTWPIRLSIAIESAEALAFLHGSDVIHRDVKTNNILLDENFCVKVADFGLSRLFPTDVTHISTAPQGTPGYVDPEYYQCYQLTEKSDVYSFGVVLIELISSLPAVDTNRHRHEINLANMAISKIQDHALDELVDPVLEKDYTVRRMTTSVAGLAFRCLQQDRDMRPSMDEVLEDLKRIKNQEIGIQKAEVVDISADDVGLLKHFPPPLSPDSVRTDKLVSSTTTPNSV